MSDGDSRSGADWGDLGVVRLDSASCRGVDVRAGDRVRLRPGGRADIFDLALAGKVATIESIEQDFEETVYVAVTVDDDPGRDFGRMRQPGHRFFFTLGEIEPLGNAVVEPEDAP